jgi:hypothetical protein
LTRLQIFAAVVGIAGFVVELLATMMKPTFASVGLMVTFPLGAAFVILSQSAHRRKP